MPRIKPRRFSRAKPSLRVSLQCLGLLDAPDSVRYVETFDELLEVAEFRKRRYRSVYGEQKFEEPSLLDISPTARIITIRGPGRRMLATARFRDTHHPEDAAALYEQYAGPEHFRGEPFAVAERLAVERGPNLEAVKLLLFKTVWLHALAVGAKHLALHSTSRLMPMYWKMGFRLPERFSGAPYQPDFGRGIAHYLMSLRLSDAHQVWRKLPTYRFMTSRAHAGLPFQYDRNTGLVRTLDGKPVRIPAVEQNEKALNFFGTVDGLTQRIQESEAVDET